MAKRYPTRSTSHELEELSERFFRSNLPRSWTCERPLHDYGVDLRVEIYEDGAATGLELLVQLKATAAATAGDAETVRLQTATYNHLRDRLQVAMLVKFVAAAREAYWLFLRDVAAPNQENDSFTIHIPKANRLSALDWVEVQRHIRAVTNVKLGATGRRGRNRA